jgi:hypothetical protein
MEVMEGMEVILRDSFFIPFIPCIPVDFFSDGL